MKIKLVTLFLFSCTFAFGQNYKGLVDSALKFYYNKQYSESVSKFKEAFKIKENQPGDLYNGSCSAALLGDKNLAFAWLNLAFKNGWRNFQHLEKDSDLVSLHKDKKWDGLATAMQKETERIEANYDKPLQAELLKIFDDDQGIRRQYIAAQKEYGHDSKQVDSLGNIMELKDSLNLIKVTSILDKYGWVGPSKVGDKANQTLFLVIQHSDLTTQQKYLPLMRDAVKKGNALPSSLALLEDRVALREGRKQIYGSQIGYDKETEKYYVLPLEDPDNVDKRRAKVGLGELSDYVKNWNFTWNSDEYKKQLPEIEAKQKKEN